ncbi:MAG: hypothetical protein LUC92_02550 [Clostridiales bacterium]|nr:hypothetical protein [Clostridiales bacterium]
MITMCNVSYGIARRERNEGRVEGKEEILVGTLKKLMKNLGIGIDQAMKLVKIPESDYPKYRRLVEG